MNLLSSILGPPMAATERPADSDDFWFNPVTPQTAGVVVTEDTAMKFATVFACVNKLAKTMATLPAHVLEQVDEDNRKQRNDHPLAQIWRVKAHPDSTAVSFRESQMLNLLLWGNAYAEIILDRGDNLLWLKPLLARYMEVRRSGNGQLVYNYDPLDGSGAVDIPAVRMLHTVGLSLNGIVGLSPITHQRLTIGLGMGAAEHAASFLRNGAVPGIVIERPLEADKGKPAKDILSRDAQARIENSFNEKHAGATNGWKTVMLREGMKLATVGMHLKDAQFVEQRDMARIDICGIFDVQPTKVMIWDHATYSNVEHAAIDWRTDSILPWCVRTENAINAKFFEGTNLSLKHNVDGLVRGDIKSRYESYNSGIYAGWLSRNDARRLEDLDPVDGLDEMLVPNNMGSAKNLGKESSQFARLFHDAAAQIVGKETKAVGNAWKRYAKKADVPAFLAWCDSFYAEHCTFIVSKVAPIVATILAFCEIDNPDRAAETDSRVVATRYIGASLATVRECNPAEMPTMIETWEETKTEELATLFLEHWRR